MNYKQRLFLKPHIFKTFELALKSRSSVFLVIFFINCLQSGKTCNRSIDMYIAITLYQFSLLQSQYRFNVKIMNYTAIAIYSYNNLHKIWSHQLFLFSIGENLHYALTHQKIKIAGADSPDIKPTGCFFTERGKHIAIAIYDKKSLTSI